jgi:hypothetical protein
MCWRPEGVWGHSVSLPDIELRKIKKMISGVDYFFPDVGKRHKVAPNPLGAPHIYTFGADPRKKNVFFFFSLLFFFGTLAPLKT